MVQRRKPRTRQVKRQPSVTDDAARALISEAVARSWVDSQDRAVVACFVGMQIAKAIFKHSSLVRNVTAEYLGLSDEFRTQLTTYRPLFDAGQAALQVLDVIDVPIEEAAGQVRLVRHRTVVRIDDDDDVVVIWRRALTGEAEHAVTTDLAFFKSLTSLFASLYRAQLGTKSARRWGGIKIKSSDDPFRLEQLARALTDEVSKMARLRTLMLHEVPIVAVAAGIDVPTGTKPIEDLVEELRLRADEWRQKPGLVRRRRPLQGRLIHTDQR